MNYFRVIILLFLSSNAVGQSKEMPLNRSLQIDIGTGRHGTGDMGGYSFNAEFRKYFRDRLSFTVGLGATIHDGSFQYGDVDSTGRLDDATFKYTAGGFQLTSKAGFSFVKIK